MKKILLFLLLMGSTNVFAVSARDKCISEVRNNDEPFHPGKQCSLELTELIELFLPLESGVNLSWGVAAGVKTPINWLTIGKSYGCDGATSSLDAPERCGEIFVTDKGVVNFNVLEKTIQPGVWTIKLFGGNAGVSKIEFNADADIGLDHILDDFKQYNLNLHLISQNDPWYGATIRENLYHLKVSGKKEAWLKDEMSCGVSGEHCGFTLTIFHNIREAKESLRFQNHNIDPK